MGPLASLMGALEAGRRFGLIAAGELMISGPSNTFDAAPLQTGGWLPRLGARRSSCRRRPRWANKRYSRLQRPPDIVPAGGSRAAGSRSGPGEMLPKCEVWTVACRPAAASAWGPAPFRLSPGGGGGIHFRAAQVF